MTQQKRVIVVYSSLSLAWLLLMLAIFSLILTGCDKDRISGSGRVVTEERQVAAFSEVRLRGPFEVRLQQGPDGPVTIEAEDNILPVIGTHVRNNVLYIDIDPDAQLRNHEPIHIYLQSRDYRSVELSGSGLVESTDTLRTDRFRCELEGSGNARFTIITGKLETELEGSGNISLKGRAPIFESQIGGSGDIAALDLQTQDAKIEVAGSGDHAVNVSRSLDVTIYGSGDVRYTGSPSIRTQILGSGKVIPL